MAINWISAVLACAFVILLVVYGRFSEDDTRSLFSASSDACGTLLGFLLAALAILTGALEKQLIANMRKTGYFDVLVSDVKQACIVLVLCVGVALVAQLFPPSGRPVAAALLIGLEVYSLGMVIVIGRQFSAVIKHLR